jgi:hypothetical protein
VNAWKAAIQKTMNELIAWKVFSPHVHELYTEYEQLMANNVEAAMAGMFLHVTNYIKATMGTYCSVFQPKAIWPAVSDSRPKWPRVAASAGPAKYWWERMAGKGGVVCW